MSSPLVDEKKSIGVTTPPKSPRAPTVADEKEMEAKGNCDGIASQGIASEPKSCGIADGEDEEECPSQKERGNDAKADDQAEAKTADPTPPESEKKLDSEHKDEDKGGTADSKGDEPRQSPRASASPPDASQTGSTKLSPRGQEGKRSPRADVCPDEKPASPRSDSKPVSPRPDPVPAPISEMEEAPKSDEAEKKVIEASSVKVAAEGDTAAPSLDAAEAGDEENTKDAEKSAEGEPVVL